MNWEICFKRSFGRLIALSLAVLSLACSQSQETAGDGISDSQKKIKVVATVNMVSDLVRQVGGDHVELVEIMGPGVDPHLYKAGANDVIKLQEADVIFHVGLLLEGKMEEVLGKLKTGGKPVYAVTRDIEQGRLLKPEEFEGYYDPHIWFEVLLWKDTVDVIVEGLTKLDSTRKIDYENNGKNLKERLDELHQWAKTKVAEVPQEKRVLVTSHDAYNYFGRAYGFKVVGLQGISTVSKAGLADRTKLVDFIKSQQVKAIFVETTVSPEAIKAIASDAGVVVGGELFSDAMGELGQMDGGLDLGSYEGMIRHNITTIVNALR